MAETIYQVVTMNGVQYYTRKQFDKKYPKQQPNTNMRLRDEIVNAPVVRELLGPMWGGVKDGKNVVRYEDSETYKRLSETKERIKSKANISFDFISEVTVDDLALTDAQKKEWIRELVYDLARLAKVNPRTFVITDVNVNSSGSRAAAQINPTKASSFDIVCQSEGLNGRGDKVEWSYKFDNGADSVDNLEKDEAVILFGNLVAHSIFNYKEALKVDLDIDTVGKALKADEEAIAIDFISDCLKKKLMYAKAISFSDISNGGIDAYINVNLLEQDGEVFVMHPKLGIEKVTGLRNFYESIKAALSYDGNIDCAFRIVPPKINMKRFELGYGKVAEKIKIEFRT